MSYRYVRQRTKAVYAGVLSMINLLQEEVPSQPGSRLLDALPAEVGERLRPELARVRLGLKEVLYEEEQPLSHVYFPVTSVVSVVTVMDNGDAVEVGTIGTEGFAGLPVLLNSGRPSSSERAFCQIPGEALRIEVEPFLVLLEREPPLYALLLRYVNAFLLQVSQSAACNRLHSIDQRCARWLLMTHDRVGSDVLALTQEFLAQMLGVRRASVNAVAGLLQKMGLIRYVRGRITVLDRPGLEAATCECYGTIRQGYERLLGPAALARPPAGES